MRYMLAVLLFSLSLFAQTPAKLPVFLVTGCGDDSTGSVVESSLRESIRSSTGYSLADRKEPGTLMVAVTCVDAGRPGEGFTAVAYMYGMAMKGSPEEVGSIIWNPALGVFTVSRAHAENKGRELFAIFDNDLNRH